MVNIHHCVSMLDFVVGLTENSLASYGPRLRRSEAIRTLFKEDIIPHHRNRLYNRAVAVVELSLKGIECDYSITALNRGDCSGFGLVIISNREK